MDGLKISDIVSIHSAVVILHEINSRPHPSAEMVRIPTAEDLDEFMRDKERYVI